MTQQPMDLPALWRVGYYANPLGFSPRELYSFNHRFDDIHCPSRLDGNACVALFEKRGTVSAAGEAIALTDPPPEPLTNVTEPWGLVLEPAPAVGHDQ